MGVTVANWLIRKIVGNERFNERVMKVNIVIWNVVWEVVSCYCPLACRLVIEKDMFYELMDKGVTSENMLTQCSPLPPRPRPPPLSAWGEGGG